MLSSPKTRRFAVVTVHLILAATVTGCGSIDHFGTRMSPSTWFSKQPAGPVAENSTEIPEEESLNPFDVAPSPPVRTASAAQEKQSSSTAASVPQFDPATMMLIETEFKDATPEERRLWYEELRQVSPEMVPRVIRMRRLALQHSEKNAAAPPSSAPAPAESSTELPVVAASAPNPVSGNDLLGLNPWDKNSQLPNQPRHLKPGDTLTVSDQTDLNSSVKPASHTGPISAPEMPSDDERNTKPDNPDQNYREALEDLIALAEQRIQQGRNAGSPDDLDAYAREHAYLRMLYLMADRRERSLEAIPDLPAAEQEFWQKLFWGLSNYFDSSGIPNRGDRATHTVSQIADAAERLRERANLEIRNVTFSTGIHGFGIYDRYERDEFRPGQPVLVYAELKNFLSELTTEGTYKTVLKSTIEIHRAGSNPGLVVEQAYPPTEDYCRTRRHDYFHSYKINIPSELTVGPYLLKLIVEDQLNRKVATYTINFTVK
ncbi:hypothetical protein [Rubinisphaera margarita]|uniref:hypothetical protein n=1 Tax=Rubinisphaera margarita TaxID=2909586 RepID=UPI001EE89D72|nr:hypothetical protein [Rubinisphaera margarita]MCG6157679.1 hypothetical protein [Rubinisphaera margarita]